MAKSMPKYVRQLKNKLYYQRDIPTRLKHLAHQKTFTYPLGLNADSHTDSSLAKAAAEATEHYELFIKTIENSDPSAFNESELDRAAAELLRRRGHSVGQYVYVKLDPALTKREEREQQQLQAQPSDYAEWAVPELEDVIDKRNRGETLTFQDEIYARAYFKLMDKASAKPKTLDLLWQDYVDHKDIDVKSRDGKRILKRWKRWLSLVGNHKIAPNTIDLIHHGIDTYIAERVKEGVKGASIKRELSDVIACLRLGSKKHRLGWVIEPPYIKQQKPKTKPVMTHEEQRKLVSYCLSQSSGRVAACVLLMLQGGMMPSEVARLSKDRVALDSTIPHVVLDQDTKTNNRKRVIPVVLGVNYIAAHIDATLEWLQGSTDSNHSHQIKKLMIQATGNEELSGHCCRHTFEANAMANQVDSTQVATIGGWSGSKAGLSGRMLAYGAEGLSQSEVIRGLYESSKKLHRHLLVEEEANNVVALRTTRSEGA